MNYDSVEMIHYMEIWKEKKKGGSNDGFLFYEQSKIFKDNKVREG